MNESMQSYAPEVVTERSVNTEMMISRQAQEVQAAMVVAKKFPRNEAASVARIMQACARKSLAEQAIYEYPRGDQVVTGPSIRLAEVLAQNWGNLDFGITELEQKNGESTVMSYAWDLETNTRQTKIFGVPHIRKTKSSTKALTDPRDIYELVANQGARRLRACILGIVPGDIVDMAIAECEKTLKGGGKKPFDERVNACIALFAEKYDVTLAQLETYIGFKREAWTEQTLIRLAAVNNSLRAGIAEVTQYFPADVATAGMQVDESTGEVRESDTPPAESGTKEVSMDDL